MLNLIWQKNSGLGQMFSVANGQILKQKTSHLVTEFGQLTVHQRQLANTL